MSKFRLKKTVLPLSYSLLAFFIYLSVSALFLNSAINKFGKDYYSRTKAYEKSEKQFISKNSTVLREVSSRIAIDPTSLIIPDIYLPSIKDGLAPAVRTLDTKQNVVFLGIDDGAYKNPKVIEIMKKNKIKASLYLADRFINDNYDFFKDMVPMGSKIENHTLHHRLLSQLTYDEQKKEICGMADLEEKVYGKRPTLFRPPGGDYNTDTQKAAAACGMKAVVLWVAKANGGSMQYQGEHKLRKGDIVLMHFRPLFL